MRFLQDFWYVIKDDVMELFHDLHNNGKFARELNSTFIILIAKKNGAKNIQDFRPISLVGCIYKLIAKVMTTRFTRVLGRRANVNMLLWREDKSKMLYLWLMRLWMIWCTMEMED